MNASDTLGVEKAGTPPRGDRKWVAHGLSNAFIYRAIAFGGTHLPLPILRGISIVGNTIAIGLMRKTVAGIAENYRIAFGLTERAARRRARQLFYAYGLTTVDLFRIREGGEGLAPSITTFENDDAVLRGLLSAGRGFLIVSGHVGNWEMGAVSLLRHGVKGAIIGQKELDPEVHAIRVEARARLGVESIVIGEGMTTALRVREAIDRGVAVAMVADRAYQDDHVSVEFFGRPTPFLKSPALLARFCGCPLLPSFFLRNREGTYRSFFGDPVNADLSSSAEDDARRMMTAVARVVERAVREAPEQWFNFYRYWSAARPRA